MKRFIPLLLVAAALALFASACGNTVKLQQSTNPKVAAEQAKAQKLIQACVAKQGLHFITKAGREAFVNCIAPASKKVVIKACAQKALASGSYLTKGQRQKVLVAVENCVVANS